MRTIEQRAEIYLKNAECFSCGTHLCLITKREHCSVFELHKGRLCNLLKEQQEIDIQRAVEIYERELKEIVSVINRFSKDNVGEIISIEGSVKDFEQAMKGDNQ